MVFCYYRLLLAARDPNNIIAWEGPVLQQDEIRAILRQVPPDGSEDYIARVLDLYARVVDQYRLPPDTAAQAASVPETVDAFASSTNNL